MIAARVWIATCATFAACAAPTPAGSDAAATGDAAPDGASGEDAPADGPPPPCSFDMPLPPPASVLWAPELSATGITTLGGHGHDDGHGAIGFCAGTRVPGQPYYRLIAAGLEIDTDIDGSGTSGDKKVHPDFWRTPATFDGFGESGGGIAVYLDIVDETGAVLSVDTNPELRVTREILDGPTEQMMLTSKPANEFQTNYPMVGGGARYGFSITGASDRVINFRLPNNHHLCYQLVFRREPPT